MHARVYATPCPHDPLRGHHCPLMLRDCEWLVISELQPSKVTMFDRHVVVLFRLVCLLDVFDSGCVLRSCFARSGVARRNRTSFVQ